MNTEFKDSQFELFPGETRSYSPPRPRYFWSQITLSLENVIVVSIVIILLMVFSFSLGVEKGKRIVRASLQSEILKAKDVITKEIEDALKAKMSTTLARAKQALLQARQNTAAASSAAVFAHNMPVSQEPRRVQTEFVPQSIVHQPPVLVPVSQPTATDPDMLKNLYTIQVASFKKEKLAQDEAKILRGKGLEIFVLSKGSYSIVCAGKFSQKAEASAALSKLRKRYKDCIVRSL